MRIIKESDITAMRQDGRVKQADGRNLKSVIPFASKAKPASVITAQERQAKALEAMVAQIALVLQNNSHSSELFLESLAKANPEIKLPKFPEFPKFPKRITSWTATVIRDEQGFVETIKYLSGDDQ